MSTDDLDALRGRLQSRIPHLRPSQAAVIRLAIEDPAYVVDATAQRVGQRVGVSAATVVRAARAVGFRGFPALRMALARSAGGTSAAVVPRLTEAKTAADLKEIILASHAESLAAVRGTLDDTAVERALEALAGADRVLAAGSGTSSPIAIDAAFRLSTAGLAVQAPVDSYSAIVVAGVLRPGDVLLAVSHSGETLQTLEVVEAAHAAGATVLAVTSFEDSTLANRAHIALVAGGSHRAEHLVESSSRLAQIIVVDILYAGLALRAAHDDRPRRGRRSAR